MRAMVRDTTRISIERRVVRLWAAIRYALKARQKMRCGASYIAVVF